MMKCALSYSNSQIIKRFEKPNSLYNEEYRKIINFNKVKKGDISVNLIHYDKNLRNNDNMKYYRYFSINVIGSYYTFDDFDMLKLLLSKIKEMPFPPCYILMMSESES